MSLQYCVTHPKGGASPHASFGAPAPPKRPAAPAPAAPPVPAAAQTRRLARRRLHVCGATVGSHLLFLRPLAPRYLLAALFIAPPTPRCLLAALRTPPACQLSTPSLRAPEPPARSPAPPHCDAWLPRPPPPGVCDSRRPPAAAGARAPQRADPLQVLLPPSAQSYPSGPWTRACLARSPPQQAYPRHCRCCRPLMHAELPPPSARKATPPLAPGRAHALAQPAAAGDHTCITT